MSHSKMNRTYRVVSDADRDFVTQLDYLDYAADLDASTETELVGEFLVAAEFAAAFERTLDLSPAVIRWEEVAGNWPAPVR